jgi:hypothetical protein
MDQAQLPAGLGELPAAAAGSVVGEHLADDHPEGGWRNAPPPRARTRRRRRRSASTAMSSSRTVTCGLCRGWQERSCRPDEPSLRKRANHVWPVFTMIPNSAATCFLGRPFSSR